MNTYKGYEEKKPKKQGRTAQLGKHNRKARQRQGDSEFITLMKAKDFAAEDGSYMR